MVDIRLCDTGNFDRALELIKQEKVGIEYGTFADPLLKNVKKEIIREKELSRGIKHKSLHAPFWDLNLGSAGKKRRMLNMKHIKNLHSI